MMFEAVNLEAALKIFKKTDDEYVKGVCKKLFEQWKPLLKGRKQVSLLMWTGDGSQILDYRGNPDDEFEWGKWIGRANCPTKSDDDPDFIDLHERKRLYTENPPVMTYGILKRIIELIKQTGSEIIPGLKVEVGEIFDIGPEFAISDFKYRRHPEVCTGNEFGGSTFVNSYGILAADSYNYAGYPDGIPEGTPFGKFFGRQSNIYLKDMGFDYIWLSNGMGFTAQSWRSTGEIFDGEKFNTKVLPKVKQMIFDFWTLFREECPDFPVHTRGTNYSAGIDYASSAVPLYDIYKGGLNLLPPPNSPWAAIDGNYGLELMGHMSRIAEIPEDKFMFRYYLHDPWWVNSPWYDRYEGQPHDIYLPMALARIDENGKTQPNNVLNVMTINNSWGDMPDNCVNESLPHLLKSEKDAPDEPSPLVWVYPTREYTTTEEESKLKEMISNDWFMCNAINNTAPVCTVVSTDLFIKHDKDIYAKSVLLSPIPDKDSEYEKEITAYAKSGGRVLFLGSLDKASDALLSLLGLELDGGISGALKIQNSDFHDVYTDGEYPKTLNLRPFICNGLLNTKLKKDSKMKEVISSGGYALAVYGNGIGWYRAPVGGDNNKNGGHILIDSGKEYIRGEELLRTVLAEYGYDIRLKKPDGNVKSPTITVHKSDNGFIFSVFTPSTTVDVKMKFPLGAPLLLGYETQLENGCSVYRFPRAEHRECRTFIEQNDGVVSAKEFCPVSGKFRRRILVSGLKNATVRFFAEENCKTKVEAVLNSIGDAWYPKDSFEGHFVNDKQYGCYYEITNVTGELAFQMPIIK